VDAHVDCKPLNHISCLRLNDADRVPLPVQIPNQSSIPVAWKAFDNRDRLLPSSNRDRLVDVCEELVKATILLLPHRDALDDRFSEREEKRAHGRLRTQAEAEAAKAATQAEKDRVASAAASGSEVA